MNLRLIRTNQSTQVYPGCLTTSTPAGDAVPTLDIHDPEGGGWSE